MSDLPPLTGPALARLLGITSRTVLRLHGIGVLPRVGKKYDPAACVQGYITYVKHDREASGDLAAARLKLTDAQRKAIEFRNELAEKMLVPIADVEVAAERIGVLYGSQLDGLPGRVAGQLAGESDPATIRKVLFDECRRIRNATALELEALAGGVPHGRDDPGAEGEDA